MINRRHFNGMKFMSKLTEMQRDARRIAKVLRDGGYSYDQSAYLIKEARSMVGLEPPKRKGGSVDRLTAEEQEAFLEAAYHRGGKQGLMMRILLETGCRVGPFTRLRVEDISFRELEVRIRGKGDKSRDVPILQSLARELRLHLGERRTGYLFPSPRGEHYTKRRIQQIVKTVAKDAEITKRVYPHLLRHTMAQRLADQGMPENLLQQFLGHDKPETTQVYYRPRRQQVKDAHREAMSTKKVALAR